MCGIFAYIGDSLDWSNLEKESNKIKYRGPDNSNMKHVGENVLFSFHRLAIMGVSKKGDQPLFHPEEKDISIICNGEIYNYKKLGEKFGFKLESGSDCEIILHLYRKFGIRKTIEYLDGVFMLVLFDKKKNKLFAARDPYGVRPGFIGYSDDGIFLASEAKSLSLLCEKITPFPPGNIWNHEENKFYQYYLPNPRSLNKTSEKDLTEGINKRLTEAVKKRMMADREVGSLLSGGLDSSLISALVNKFSNKKLKTFSIGMPDSIDLQYAQVVAKHLNTDHYNIEISTKNFLNSIEKVIYNIESFDTTTVRASVGNYLVSKFIRDNSDCKVIFNGDGSDEVCGGYLYMRDAPNPEAFQEECERLVNELYFFDVLRSDRSISSNGLEARTPFLDKKFVQYYLSIPPEKKIFDGKEIIEKRLLREAFYGTGILPDSVLWRRKCAFSDGVSTTSNSWHHKIKDFVENEISDNEFIKESKNISHCRPLTKESYYYRKIFDSFFGKRGKLIPHFWMPRWSNTTDPSARELSNYTE